MSHGKPVATGPKLSGVVGFFEDPHGTLEAMKKVRDAKYSEFDAFTPFPIHGMNEAQGLPRSLLPWVTFVMGVTGMLAGFGLQYWTSVIDWPIIVAGKPFNSWPAFVPVMFEATILIGGVSTVLALFALCRLPNTSKAAFDPSITNDKFAIWIGARDCKNAVKKFNESEVQTFLRQIGAKDVRTVYETGWF